MELPLVRGQLYINDEARIDALRAGAVRRRDLIPPTASIAKFRVGLRGLGNHGVHIAAAELVVFIDGDTPTEDIAPMHKAWWWYYEDYCRRRGTASALPLDRTCEATLAAGLTDRSE